jgi:hypothetical protein
MNSTRVATKARLARMPTRLAVSPVRTPASRPRSTLDATASTCSSCKPRLRSEVLTLATRSSICVAYWGMRLASFAPETASEATRAMTMR